MIPGEMYWKDALCALAQAGDAAGGAEDSESALLCFTRAARDSLGDDTAHLRPGALKPGERQYSIAGAFMLSDSGADNILIAEVGFPPEQHRLKVPASLGHPGWVVRTRQPLILANTDEHAEFKQILKTSRMGSALYAPLIWRGSLLGQIVVASQARNTYSGPDLEVLVAFANAASAAYIAHGGATGLPGS